MLRSSRTISDKPSCYSSGVLLGNWLEERVGKYKKNRYQHVTTYKHDFTPKYSTDKRETDNKRNDTKITSEYGDNISPPKITDDGPNFYDNFTSTYDLSFQYFPKWIPETLNRKMRFMLLKYEPMEEYLSGYGNLSSRNGLTNDKREEWACDVLDPRRPVFSIMKTDFTPNKANILGNNAKWPRLGPVKVKCGKVKEMVYKSLPTEHPRSLEVRVNPITWEGESEKNVYQQCVCKM